MYSVSHVVLDGARDPVYLGGDCGLYSENFELGPGWRAET
jgi:hypothetical protein